MSWGIKITVMYLGFVGLILTLVFTCYGQTVELESKDYYAKELKFQDQIDATNNANALSTPITHEVKGKSVELVFPKDLSLAEINGNVNFLRPSDSTKDRNVVIKPDADGKQTISDPGFSKGVYKMQVSFTCAGKSYYHEALIFLN